MIDRFNQWAADGGPLELIPILVVAVAACIALSTAKR